MSYRHGREAHTPPRHTELEYRRGREVHTHLLVTPNWNIIDQCCTLKSGHVEKERGVVKGGECVVAKRGTPCGHKVACGSEIQSLVLYTKFERERKWWAHLVRPCLHLLHVANIIESPLTSEA
jgi:hypothetical protein